MKKLRIGVIICLILMAVFAFSSLLNIEIDGNAVELAGVTIIIGIVAFFVNKKKDGML